MLFYFPQH